MAVLNAFMIRSAGTDCLVPVQVTLNYHPDTDPLAVEAVFQGDPSAVDAFDEDGDPVTWYFARDLLSAAVATSRPTGIGDVRFRAGFSNCLFLCLRSPYSHADFKLPMDGVKAFLGETAWDAAQCLATLNGGVDAFLEEVLG